MELPDGTVRKRRRAINTPWRAHELTFTCYRRMRLLNRDRTRWWVLGAMEHARRMHDLRIIAYVIMPEHVHILLRPNRPEYSMPAIYKSLKQGVSRRAVAWLKAHAPDQVTKLRVEWPDGRREHRFWQQGGGYDRNMWSAEAIRNSILYIHRNPVEAGLVEHACDWVWSSARAYRGDEDVVFRVDAPRL